MKEKLEILEAKVREAIVDLGIGTVIDSVSVQIGSDAFGDDLLEVTLESKMFDGISDDDLLKLGDTVEDVIGKADERSSIVHLSEAA